MSRSRIVAGWIALAAASASGPAPAAQPDARPVLRILNGSDYIDLDEAVPAPAPIPDRSPAGPKP